MNTNTIALETYTNRIVTVAGLQADFAAVPLVKHRANMAGPTQRLATLEQVEARKAEVFGGAIHDAGMAFLASIHEEIRANEPQWKKDLREQELELERISQEKAACAEVASMSAE